jgi:hypothetical protein
MEFVDDIERKIDPRDTKAFLAALEQKVLQSELESLETKYWKLRYDTSSDTIKSLP